MIAANPVSSIAATIRIAVNHNPGLRWRRGRRFPEASYRFGGIVAAYEPFSFQSVAPISFWTFTSMS